MCVHSRPVFQFAFAMLAVNASVWWWFFKMSGEQAAGMCQHLMNTVLWAHTRQAEAAIILSILELYRELRGL